MALPFNSNLSPKRVLLLFCIVLSGVRLSPLDTGLLYQPQMIDGGDCRAIGGMRIGRGNQSTRRKPAPAPQCPPQIPHDQTLSRTRGAAVGSRGAASQACNLAAKYSSDLCLARVGYLKQAEFMIPAGSSFLERHSQYKLHRSQHPHN
jgi:hypothetical protein